MAWRAVAYRAVRPLLFSIDPERIHHLTIDALRVGGQSPIGRGLAALAGGALQTDAPVEVAGLTFRSRIGVGAGFDKDAVALRGWAALGLGFAEVGTVTPLPQPGHPRPRLFRLSRDEALINRMGFNNAGAEAVARNLAAARDRLPSGFVVGVNIGRNAATAAENAVADFLAAQAQLAPLADYLVVNVSSPNTPGLRDLQAPRRLRRLLAAMADNGERLSCARPLFVKLAPDLHPGDMEAVLAARLKSHVRRPLPATVDPLVRYLANFDVVSVKSMSREDIQELLQRIERAKKSAGSFELELMHLQAECERQLGRPITADDLYRQAAERILANPALLTVERFQRLLLEAATVARQRGIPAGQLHQITTRYLEALPEHHIAPLRIPGCCAKRTQVSRTNQNTSITVKW